MVTVQRQALSSHASEVAELCCEWETPRLRQVLGRFVTGVTVITTSSEDGSPIGLTANSFNSLSLDPPLVLWSLGAKQGSSQAFRQCSRFAINILAESQVELSRRFSRPAENRFEGVSYSSERFGVPLINDCLAWLVCEHYQQHELGDHILFIGRVTALGEAEQRPLAYHAGAYTRVDTLVAGSVVRA